MRHDFIWSLRTSLGDILLTDKLSDFGKMIIFGYLKTTKLIVSWEHATKMCLLVLNQLMSFVGQSITNFEDKMF